MNFWQENSNVPGTPPVPGTLVPGTLEHIALLGAVGHGTAVPHLGRVGHGRGVPHLMSLKNRGLYD